MRKSLFFIASLLCILSSCKETPDSKTERSGEPDVYNVDEDNARMNKAMNDAKNSLQAFKDALSSENPSYEYFTLKQKFEANDGTEHIWVRDIQLEDNNLTGIIANEPIYGIGVKLNDTISIDQSNVSDWMYYEDGKVVGGYTIRAIRDGLSPEEQAAFDAENGLIFK